MLDSSFFFLPVDCGMMGSAVWSLLWFELGLPHLVNKFHVYYKNHQCHLHYNFNFIKILLKIVFKILGIKNFINNFIKSWTVGRRGASTGYPKMCRILYVQEKYQYRGAGAGGLIIFFPQFETHHLSTYFKSNFQFFGSSPNSAEGAKGRHSFYSINLKVDIISVLKYKSLNM